MRKIIAYYDFYYCITSLALVLHFGQTDPSPGIIPCPGDRVVLNCTTDTGSVVWQTDDGGITALQNVTKPVTIGSFLLVVSSFDDNFITSTATIDSVTVSLNGIMIGCSDRLIGNYTYLPINVTG